MEKKTGILEVVIKDTPILGNTDIHVGIDKPSFTVTDPKIPEQSIKKPQEPIATERQEEAPENVVVPEIQVEPQENVIVPENPVETRHPVDSKQPMESEGPDEFPPLDFIDIKEVEKDGNPPDLVEEQILSDKPVDDSLGAAIQKLLEAGNKQVLNNSAKTGAYAAALNPAEDESKPIDSHYVSKAVTMPGPSLSGPGAPSSSANSSANTGLGDLLAVRLNTIRYMASETTIIALFKVKTMRTKWNKEPPIKPPKQSFFLS